MLAYYTYDGKPPACMLPAYKAKKFATFGRGNGRVFYFIGTATGQPDEPPESERHPIDDKGSYCWSLTPTIDLELIKKPHAPLGNAYKLGDDQLYYAPTVRIFPDGSDLPANYVWGKRTIKPEYVKAESWFGQINAVLFTGTVKEDFNVAEVYADILGVNYFIDQHHVNAYGLIEDLTLRDFFMGIGDYTHWESVIADMCSKDENKLALVEQKKN